MINLYAIREKKTGYFGEVRVTPNGYDSEYGDCSARLTFSHSPETIWVATTKPNLADLVDRQHYNSDTQAPCLHSWNKYKVEDLEVLEFTGFSTC